MARNVYIILLLLLLFFSFSRWGFCPATEAAERQAEAVPKENHLAAGERAKSSKAAATRWQEGVSTSLDFTQYLPACSYTTVNTGNNVNK